jgi:hypothetical protein
LKIARAACTMPRVASELPGRASRGFAIGNLVSVLLLSLGLFGLPVRYWVADTLVLLVLASILAGSVTALARPALAWRALRIAALSLLGIGLLLIAVAALSLAFLSGVHGDYGRGGVLLMALVLLAALPYTIVYPVIELVWLHRRRVVA